MYIYIYIYTYIYICTYTCTRTHTQRKHIKHVIPCQVFQLKPGEVKPEALNNTGECHAGSTQTFSYPQTDFYCVIWKISHVQFLKQNIHKIINKCWKCSKSYIFLDYGCHSRISQGCRTSGCPVFTAVVDWYLVANGQATVALELHHKSPVTHLSVSSRRGKSQFVASRVQRVLKS